VKCQSPKEKQIFQKKNGYLSDSTYRYSTEIGESQKKTNSPKENQSTIYLPTSTGSTIIYAQQT
jgi:hypothetical protein